MSGHARPDISESVVIADLRPPTNTARVRILLFIVPIIITVIKSKDSRPEEVGL